MAANGLGNPGVAVAIIWEQATHLLVGLDGLPAIGEVGDHVLQAPEHVIRPVEALGRVALASEEPGLPWHDARNAGHFVKFAHITDRVGGFGRAGGEHQRDLVLEHQVVGDLASTVGVGLAVLEDDLHRVLLATDGDPALEGHFHLFDDPFVGLTKRSQWPGLWRHVTNLDRIGGPDQRAGPGRGRDGQTLRELSA
jgi:hypothetical protein